MKYTLTINQLGAAIAGLSGKLDIIDLAIFDAFKDFANGGKVEKKFDGGRVWFWVSYALVLDNIPFVPVYTKDAVYRRMKKLADVGVIEFHPDNQKTGKAFFAWGPTYDSLNCKEFTSEQIAALFARPTDAEPYPYGFPSVPPTDAEPYNNSTIDKGINKGNLLSESKNSDGLTFQVDVYQKTTEAVAVEEKKEKPPIPATPRVTIKEPTPDPVPKRDNSDPRPHLNARILNGRAMWRYLKAIGGKEKEMEALSKEGIKMGAEYILESNIDAVVRRLNQKGNFPRGYRTDKKETRTAIRKRLNEYPLEDLYTVIDFKCREWKDEPKLRQYLRPDTLFNGHFEAYLNAALLDKQNPITDSKAPAFRLDAPAPSTHQPTFVE